MKPAPLLSAAEIDTLLDGLSDGTLSAADETRLHATLLGSREARDAYRSQLRIEALLECGIAGGEQSDLRPTRQEPRPQWRMAGSVLAAIVTAAAGAVVVASLLLVARVGLVSPGASPAVLTAATDPVFGGEAGSRAAQYRVGDRVAAGPMRLESGAVQLTFASGAVVGVNAPAELEIVNGSRVFLRSGRIVPLVPPRAKGFTVVAPSGEIVDLGTEFSVSVDAEGKSDVHVLDGEVTVASGHGGPLPPQHLTTGYAASMSAAAMQVAARVTAVPLFLDDFTRSGAVALDLSGGSQQRGILAPLAYRSLEREASARVRAGRIEIPFDAATVRQRSFSRVAIDHCFEEVKGRRWSVAFKAWLPPAQSMPKHHWVACVVGAGDGPNDLPFAWDQDAAVAVMISSMWQAGIDFSGPSDPPPQQSLEVFPRSLHDSGAYQVLMQIDETRPGDAIVDVTVNGRDLLRGFRFPIDRDRPRLIGFQTWTHAGCGANAYARIDDVCVSVEQEEAVAAATP